MTIIDQIKRDEREFHEPIKVVDGLNFNHPETLNKIYLYNNSSFKSNSKDPTTGFDKFFYNINLTPCEVARKSIEFDTKDVRFFTASGGSTIKTWFLEQDFKFWAKKNRFGSFINELLKRLPRHGSAVTKTIDGEPNFVDLRNFIVEPSADNLEGANYIIEKHYYTPVDFARVADEKNWDNKEETLEAYRKTDNRYITVYERYGELTTDQIKKSGGTDTEYEYARAIYADISEDESDVKDKSEEGPSKSSYRLSVDEFDKDNLPYDEFHFTKKAGRWLGKGITELLFQPQHRINELINLQIQGSYYTSLNIFQTVDTDLERNLLTDVANGDILEVEEGISQVPMNQQNLQSLMQEQQQWLNNRDELSFSSEITRGGKLPSGTTLGSIKMASQSAGMYFDVIRENIADDVKAFLKKRIIPHFDKYANKEHRLLIAGEKLNKIQKLDKQRAMERWRRDFYNRNHEVPSQAQTDITKQYIESQLSGERERSQKVNKGYYENIDYDFDIVISGETMDTQVQAANLQMALQAVTSDPSVLQDPVKRTLFYKVLEAGGINPEELQDVQQEQSEMGSTLRQMRSETEQMKRGGGGVARPQFPGAGASGQFEQQV